MSDIVIIYNQNSTNMENLLADINRIHKDPQFTIEKEQNIVNFFDITINRNNSSLKYEIYRKPIKTSQTLHNRNCHPTEHKLRKITYLANRLVTYQLSDKICTG